MIHINVERAQRCHHDCSHLESVKDYARYFTRALRKKSHSRNDFRNGSQNGFLFLVSQKDDISDKASAANQYHTEP